MQIDGDVNPRTRNYRPEGRQCLVDGRRSDGRESLEEFTQGFCHGIFRFCPRYTDLALDHVDPDKVIGGSIDAVIVEPGGPHEVELIEAGEPHLNARQRIETVSHRDHGKLQPGEVVLLAEAIGRRTGRRSELTHWSLLSLSFKRACIRGPAYNDDIITLSSVMSIG